MALDSYDKKIIRELTNNARQSAAKIAKKIKLPKETVNYRIKKLIQEKYIDYFYTIINATQLGYHYYKIFIQTTKIQKSEEETLIRYLKKQRYCANIRITEGYYDLTFLSMFKYPQDLKKFMNNLKKRFGTHIKKHSINLITTSHKLNTSLSQIKNTKYTFSHEKPKNLRLKKIDIEITKLITLNARIKIITLAKMLNVAPQKIQYHLKKLEKENIIVGYSLSFNKELFSTEPIQIDISVNNPQKIKEIIAFFNHTNTCHFAYELLGEYDLSIELSVNDDTHLRDIIAQFKQQFIKDYISYTISHIYQEYITNWSPFSQEI